MTIYRAINNRPGQAESLNRIGTVLINDPRQANQSHGGVEQFLRRGAEADYGWRDGVVPSGAQPNWKPPWIPTRVCAWRQYLCIGHLIRPQRSRFRTAEAARRRCAGVAGYSAGACLLIPDLRGLESSDDPAEVEPACGIEPLWDGLGLVDHRIVPHLDSATDPDGMSAVLAARYRAEGIPHWALTDNDVIASTATISRPCGRRNQKQGCE